MVLCSSVVVCHRHRVLKLYHTQSLKAISTILNKVVLVDIATMFRRLSVNLL